MTDIFDKFRLTGQVAVVTGAAGLLGRQFCRTLAQAGASVMAADLNLPAVSRIADDLQKEGHSVFAFEVDVTLPDSTRLMAETAEKMYGRLDCLVCSAALDPKFDPQHEGQHSNRFEDYPLESWKQALDVNLTGMFLSTQACVQPMLKQDHGSIILICSTYGLAGPDQRIYQREGQPPQYKPVYYSVTKAGVLGLVRYLATYYAGKNIRTNALTPGGVYNKHDEVFTQAYAARTVMGRMARQDEMNGALLFLASDASSYMTGSNLVVDGGWTAW
jgi:NAD(P)-dependent dehydrogenase (short-subunit alcohol dehydrogenase family)